MKFTITVSQDELGVIGRGLEELPWRLAMPVIAALNEQINAQSKPTPVDTKKVDPAVSPRDDPKAA